MPIRAVFAAAVVVASLSTAAVVGLPAAPAAADVNDFTFDSYSADYYLGLDPEGRTTLTTVETLVAEFPAIDQNHGLLRLIPKVYDGHPTDVHVVSVTDGQGNPRPFRPADDDEKKSGADDFYQLVSRDPNYVHGKQAYVITYTQRNVTKYFADTGDDEFYWDLNGTGWGQPFASVDARIHVVPALAKAYNGKTACYVGYSGSNTRCGVTVTTQSDGSLLATVTPVPNVLPNQTVTVAIGFRPGTIVARDSSFFASPSAIPLLLGVLLMLAAFAAAIVTRVTRLRDARGRLAVIAEYTPPPGYDLLSDAMLLGQTKRASAAQIVDLAVRGNIRIIEGKGGFFQHTQYTLEFLNDTGLGTYERAFAFVFFGTLTPGAQYTIVKNDTARGRAVYTVMQTVRKAVTERLYAKLKIRTKFLPILAGLIAIGVTFVGGTGMINDARGGLIPFVTICAVIVLGVIGLSVIGKKPLNTEGAELRDDLEGLRLYIRLAEADRLRVLQSPTGALRAPISTSDPRVILKINERLLPYAVMFGLEREWAAELGRYYDSSTPPSWYSGSGAFNSALFASSIGGFASSTSSSFAGSAASSSSGGSGGGGGAGGGGGGGGGGGV